MRLFGPPNISKLSSRGDIKGLIKALSHGELATRSAAAQALGRIAAYQRQRPTAHTSAEGVKALELAVEPLFAALEDDETRAIAAEALAKLLLTKRLDRRLRDMLSHRHADVRVPAATALGELMEPSSVSVLLRACRDKDAHVRAEAVWALGKLYPPDPVRTYRKTGWVITSAEPPRWRRKPNSRVTTALTRAASDKDQVVRLRAAWALGRPATDWGNDELLQALNDDHEEIRRTAATFLTDADPIGSDAVIEPLARALQDSDAKVRFAAVHSLGRSRDERAFETLYKAFCDEDQEVRAAAISGLAWLRTRESARVLVSALCDDSRRPWLNKSMRSHAASSLRALKDPSTVEAVLEIADARPPAARRSALGVLPVLGLSEPTARAIVGLKSDELSVRRASAWTLRAGGKGWEATALRSVSQDLDEQVRYRAAFAGNGWDDLSAPDLVAALRDEHWQIRRDAARALGSRAIPESIDELARLLADSSGSVRSVAAAALGAIGDVRAFSPLLVVLNDDDDGVAAAALDSILALWHAEAPQEVIHALRRRRAWIRWALAWEAGRIGEQEGADALLESLPKSDSDCIAWLSQAECDAEGTGLGSLGRLHWLGDAIDERILARSGAQAAEAYAREAVE